MRYTDLVEKLIKKLGSRATVYRRAGELGEELFIPTKEAMYLLAFSEKIGLEDLLDGAEKDRLRVMYFTYKDRIGEPSTSKDTAKTPETRKNRRKSKGEVVLNIDDLGNIVPRVLLPEQKFKDAVEMAKMYILLYVVENSIREVIDLRMHKIYGPNWWDLKVQKKRKDKVDERKQDEHANPWFGQERGARQIDYLDLNELPDIIHNNEKDFIPDIFPTYSWIDEKIHDLYRSRCVVAHMNHLKKYNREDVKGILRKLEAQIKAKKTLIMP